MAKFNEYTQKATPADNDTMMIYDAAAKANKLSPFSGIWNWIVGKLTNAVISNLQTSNKSVIGALNELNSNLLKIQTGTNERSIVVNVFDGDYIGGSFLLFGRSNPNDLTAAVFTCFRKKRSDDVEAKILALDGATYNTVADNKSVTITGSRITPYSKFALLSADAFSQTFIQTK